MTLPDLNLLEAGPADADTALILLHGFGADGRDLGPLAELLTPSEARWRFIFPDAPERPLRAAGGMTLRAWYDLDPDGFGGPAEEIATAEALALALVQRERERGIAAERIVLGGFSQGGMIALNAFLSAPHTLACAIGLSTCLLDHERAAERCGLANAGGAIFLAHGTADPMIPVGRAAAGRSELERLGYAVQWHSLPMGHEIRQEEILALGHWLRSRLGSQ